MDPTAAALRLRAEELLQTQPPPGEAPLSGLAVQKLVHELQVHQIELELQNEQLSVARANAETALARYTDLYDFAPVGYFTLRRFGEIAQTNLAGARLLGVERAWLMGRHFGEFVSALDLPVFKAFLLQVCVGEVAQSCEVELTSAAQRPCRVYIKATLAADGQECRLVVEDITERKMAEQALRESEYFAKAVVDAVSPHICVLDPTGKIVAVNQNWRNFYDANHPPARHGCYGIGSNNCLALCDASAGAGAEEAAPMAAGIRQVISGAREAFTLEYPCHSPTEKRWFSATVTRFPDPSGNLVVAHENITERKHAEVEIFRAKDEAERANRAKSEFLSRMSHELRTPLNAILGFGQLLAREKLPVIQADNVQEVLHAGRHLLELINEVLDLARIESGKFTVSLEPVALHVLIAECLALIRPQAEARGIRIGEVGPDCDQYVQADRTRLKQVLLNLLSNAVKYNRDAGSVSVSCKSLGGRVQICISDTGPGLSLEQQARLFKPFERLDADNSGIEGTGIGLALSKGLVEVMDGEIGIDSTPGIGSAFWVTLPVAAGEVDATHPDALDQPAGEPLASGQPQFIILCIEDNPANLRLIERILACRPEIRLISASAPGLGLELAGAHRPALILLDINLPDMDGFGVMACLRENAATRDIPVIGISANAMPTDVERARAAGFVDYLTKPLDIGKLLQTIAVALALPRS